MASLILRIENEFREVLDAQIFDAERLAQARAKARRYLGHTFCRRVRKTRLDDYEYWTAVDVADIDKWKKRNDA